MKAKSKQKATGKNRPTHIAYWVRQRDDKKGDWRPIGAAWLHADGKGLSVTLELQPPDGRVTLRVIEDKEDGNE